MSSCCESCKNCSQKAEQENKTLYFIRMFIGIVLFVSSFSNVPFKPAFFIASYLLIGADVLIASFKNILKGQIFDEKFLMSIATIGAISISEFPEAVAVMMFYKIGEFFEKLAIGKSRKSITSLLNLKPETANIEKDGEIFQIPPEKIKINDIVIVRPGEKIPVDGIIIDGSGSLDTASLTGESMPKEVWEGDAALSGAISLIGVLKIQASKTPSIHTQSSPITN
ncbi:P-type ATPase [Treponema sp. R6D11]